MRPAPLPYALELPARILAEDMQAGLKLLLEAHECAAELGKNPWEFGLELSALQTAGLSHSQVRWLLCQGYVQQAVEITPIHEVHRTFRPVANLTLHQTGCFILTTSGINLLRQVAGSPQHPAPANHSSPPPTGYPLPVASLLDSANSAALSILKPRWLADCRELRLGEHPIKKFRRPAANQITLLTAFEEDGWPHRIDNPLPPTRDGNDAARLQEAIRRLNHCQQTPLLRFHGDGTGTGVTWEIAR